MKNLRTTIIAGIALIAGCGIGASVVQMTAVRNAKASVLKQMTAVMAMEHLSHAQLLRKGRHDQVLSMIEGTLPDTVRWYSSFGYTTRADIQLLWRIRDHCDANRIPLPAEIQTTLDTLPPRPPVVCATDGAAKAEQPDGPSNGSQPAGPETDSTSPAAGSRR